MLDSLWMNEWMNTRKWMNEYYSIKPLETTWICHAQSTKGYEVHGAQRLVDRNIELFPLALFATDDPIGKLLHVSQ